MTDISLNTIETDKIILSNVTVSKIESVQKLSSCPIIDITIDSNRTLKFQYYDEYGNGIRKILIKDNKYFTDLAMTTHLDLGTMTAISHWTLTVSVDNVCGTNIFPLPKQVYDAFRIAYNSYVLIPAGIEVTERAKILGHSVDTNLRYYSFSVTVQHLGRFD